ncbi:hypothetical protein IEO21_07628 [Rhodonia placenta]|uniref:F-box domain-containing protein n=1 Tax=Rhodonia placenta TaxID=104341 RepID=A0A8H7NXU0_9APHY|nr:hypothetical protein IEO21_07628 [Postia placenta]
MPATLSTMPEEILERILELVVTPATLGTNYRPAWHPAPAAPTSSTHLAPLLVSHTWLRIATPLHYRHIVLRSAQHTVLLARTLRANPELGRWVRSVRVEGAFAALPDVVRCCPQLEGFDMTVDNGSDGDADSADEAEARVADAKVVRFCSAFAHMRQIKHLVIRKNAYLTQPRPTLIFEELGKAISRWTHLETVNIAFRFSPSPASASFAASLAVAPRLRHVRALLPAVWNNTLLEISANPALERIQLTPDTELIGAHLFLSEARKHARLIELIRAGTPIMRMRARTTTAVPMSAPVSVSPTSQAPYQQRTNARRTKVEQSYVESIPLSYRPVRRIVVYIICVYSYIEPNHHSASCPKRPL